MAARDNAAAKRHFLKGETRYGTRESSSSRWTFHAKHLPELLATTRLVDDLKVGSIIANSLHART